MKGRHERRLTALLFCRLGASIFKSYNFGRSNSGEDTPIQPCTCPFHAFTSLCLLFCDSRTLLLLPLPSLHDQLPHYAFTLDCSNVYILPSRHLTDHFLTSCFPAFLLSSSEAFTILISPILSSSLVTHISLVSRAIAKMRLRSNHVLPDPNQVPPPPRRRRQTRASSAQPTEPDTATARGPAKKVTKKTRGKKVSIGSRQSDLLLTHASNRMPARPKHQALNPKFSPLPLRQPPPR